MGFPFDRGHGWGSCPQDWQGNQHHHCYHHPHQCYYHSPKKINKNLQWQNRCLGWGPLPPMLASRQEMFLSRLNFISDADDYWTSFQTLNNEHWALFQMLTNEQRVKTTMMFDADQLRQFVRRITLPPNFTSSWSRWWSWSSWCWCRWRASWSPCWPTPRQSSASGHPMWMRNFNSNLNARQD